MAGFDLNPICQPESAQAPLYVDRHSLCEKKTQLTEVLLLQRKKTIKMTAM